MRMNKKTIVNNQSFGQWLHATGQRRSPTLCSICQFPMLQFGDPVCRPNFCGHWFHLKCLQQFRTKVSKHCPLCRQFSPYITDVNSSFNEHTKAQITRYLTIRKQTIPGSVPVALCNLCGDPNGVYIHRDCIFIDNQIYQKRKREEDKVLQQFEANEARQELRTYLWETKWKWKQQQQESKKA